MGRSYRLLFDQFLVHTDPEWAHHQAFAAIRAARPALRLVGIPGRPVEAMGLLFPNVLGVAAGFDKDGLGIDALAGLGFGHVEVGTITGEPQPGNPQPRLFRLPSDRAIVNRMGFNNDGAEVVAARLKARAERLEKRRVVGRVAAGGVGGRVAGGGSERRGVGGRVAGGGSERRGVVGRVAAEERGGVSRPGPVLGVNIGKTKAVPDDDDPAVRADYAKSTRLLAPYADYLVVNVSSPNTPGLRDLQAVERLQPLLEHVRRTADAASGERRVPLLVKIGPDLADDDILAVADMAMAIGLDGIVATNTTTSRAGLRAHPHDIDHIGAGGLSGDPLRARANEVVALLRGRVDARLTLIGVGGITSVDDARERLAAGADLLQGYSAFIYEGPWWARRIADGVA